MLQLRPDAITGSVSDGQNRFLRFRIRHSPPNR